MSVHRAHSSAYHHPCVIPFMCIYRLNVQGTPPQQQLHTAALSMAHTHHTINHLLLCLRANTAAVLHIVHTRNHRSLLFLRERASVVILVTLSYIYIIIFDLTAGVHFNFYNIYTSTRQTCHQNRPRRRSVLLTACTDRFRKQKPRETIPQGSAKHANTRTNERQEHTTLGTWTI